MQYLVKFEIYGKRLKTTVEANSPEEAKREVLKRLIWHSVEPKDPMVENLKNLFNFK